MRVRSRRTREVYDAHVRALFIVLVGNTDYEVAEFAQSFELLDRLPDRRWSEARRWFSRTHGEPAPVLERAKLRVLPFRGRARGLA